MGTRPEIGILYADMLRARLFEEAIGSLWKEGLVSGEMHLGTGEEGINVGTISHLEEGDAMALDHRATPPLLLRGVDPVLILRELLGRPDGLCAGMGGHMHLFSRDHLAASTGIVGAGGPTVAGFALAARTLRPGSVAIAFFGEGALNQGMMMESLNLAAVWRLPVVFVCKNDDWSITTPSDGMTAGSVDDRVRGFGMDPVQVDGRDVQAVWDVAGEAIAGVRAGDGPAFIHARCVHLEGHFLGYQLLRIVRHPARELPGIAAPLARSIVGRGAGVGDRVRGVRSVLSSLVATMRDPREDKDNDPLARTRGLVDPDRVRDIEDVIAAQIGDVVTIALGDSSP